MNRKKLIICILFFVLMFTSCKKEQENKFNIGIVSETNISKNNHKMEQIKQGIDSLGEKYAYDIAYDDDNREYISSMQNFINDEFELVLATSFIQNEAVETIASQNEESQFIVLDSVFDYGNKNVFSVNFNINESAYLVGYIAGLTTKSNAIGYIGFKNGTISDLYEYGFKAGLLDAAKELDKEIAIKVEYVDTFSDYNLGKEIANTLYNQGIDIIYQTVGETGLGVIDSAIENNKFAIGNEYNQSEISKQNVLTSSVINYKDVISSVLLNFSNLKENKLNMGLKDNAVGISQYEEDGNLDLEIYNKANVKRENIISGKITVPYDNVSFESFKNK